MEQVTIWFATDNDNGKKIAQAVAKMGLSLNLIEGLNLEDANIIQDEINLFIFDLDKEEPDKILEVLARDGRIQSFLKFLILSKKEIKAMVKTSFNILHLEFVSRPVDLGEFLLLLEKSIIVERYREMMKFISQEAESRIETYEGLMDINRKNIFESDKEKQSFEKILEYEKNLLREQSRLNRAIKDFTILRHEEMFDMKRRIRAEEMLSDLRRREMIDAKSTIVAQESVIDYSSNQLEETKQILDASERVAELSRSEAIDLHEELEREKEMNRTLADEIERLLEENLALKKQLNQG